MKVRESYIQKLKEMESFRPNVYRDAGQLSYGYGIKYSGGPLVITEEEADKKLRQKIKETESFLSKNVNRQLTQSQFESVVDVHYNMRERSASKLRGYLNSNMSNEAFANKLLSYNKAENPKTGTLEPLAGLTKRAAFRKNMFLNLDEELNSPDRANEAYNTESTYAQANVLDPNNQFKTDINTSPNKIKADMNGIMGVPTNVEEGTLDAPSYEQDLDASFADLDENKAPGYDNDLNESFAELSPGSPIRADKTAERITLLEKVVSPEERDKEKLTNDIIDEFGVDPQVARSVVESMGADEYRLQKSVESISSAYPRLAKWATNPYNRELLKDEPDKVKKLHILSTSMAPNRSDYGIALDKSSQQFRRAWSWFAGVNGFAGKEDTIKNLQNNDLEKIPQYSAETRKDIEELTDINRQFGDFLSGTFKGTSLSEQPRTVEGAAAYLLATPEVRDGVELFKALSSWLGGIALRGKAATVQATEMAVQLITGMGGIPATQAVSSLPFISSPVGAALTAGGLATTFGAGFLVDFGQRMDELSTKFMRDDGSIDYASAFNDKDFMTEARKDANIHSAIMGAGDLVLGALSGQVLKTTAIGAGLKEGAKGIAKTAGKEAVAGGVSMTGASISADVGTDVIMGREISDDVMKNYAERAIDNGISGFLMGGVFGAAMGSGKLVHQEAVVTWGARKANKISEMLKAEKGINASKQMQEEMSSMPNEKHATKQLVEESLTSEPKVDRMLDESNSDAISREASTISKEGLDGKVRMRPSDVDSLIQDYGLDLNEVIDALGPDVVRKLNESRLTDSSVIMDMYDYQEATIKVPELDDIARFNDNVMNARNADETFLDLIEDPTKTASEESIPPVIKQVEGEVKPGTEGLDADLEQTIVESSGRSIEETYQGPYTHEAEVDMLFDPTNIDAKYAPNSKERNQFKTIKRTLKSSLKKAVDAGSIDVEAANILSEVQYRRIRQRAIALDIDMDTLVNDFKTASGKGEGLVGWVEPTNKIVFTPDATPTAVVHELSHSWLVEMTNDYQHIKDVPFAEMNVAQREYYAAMDTAAKAMDLENLGELDSLSAEAQGKYHEQFAITAERYFLEGKFKNNKIRYAMEKLRTYMLNFMETIGRMYKNIGSFKLDASVERMFEQILGVTAEAQKSLGRYEADLAFDVDLLGSKAEKVFLDVDNAKMESIGERASKMTNKHFKDRERIIGEHQNRVTEEANAEINSMPEMQHLLAMQVRMQDYKNRVNAVRNTGGKESSVLSPRIDKASFEVLAKSKENAEALRKVVPREIVEPKSSRAKGVDYKNMMEELGTVSEREFIESLMIMGKKDELTNAKIKQKFEDEFPAVKTDKDVYGLVEDQLSYEGEKKMVDSQIKTLMSKYITSAKEFAALMIEPGKAVNRKFLQSIAKSEVLKTKLTDFKPAKFMSEFISFSREAARQFRENRYVESTNAKIRSSIALESKTVADKAMKDLVRTSKYRKNILNRLKSRDRNYSPEILLLGKNIIDAVEGGVRVEMIPRETLDSLNILPENGLEINMAISTFNGQLDNSPVGRDITVKGQLSFGGLLKTIQEQSFAAMQMEVDGQKVLVEDIAATVSFEADNSRTPIRSLEGSDSVWKSYRAQTANINAEYGSLFPSFDAFTKSTFGKLILQVKEAQDVSLIEKESIQKRVDKKINALINKEYKKNPLVVRAISPILRGKNKLLGGKDLDHSLNLSIQAGDYFDGLKFDSVWDFMTAELLMGSESGAEKLIYGGILDGSRNLLIDGVTKAEMDFDGAVAKWGELRRSLIEDGIVTKDHYDVISTIWGEMENLHPRFRDTVRSTDRVAIGKIDGWKVETPWGDLGGGYFPVSSGEAPMLSLNQPGIDVNNSYMSEMYPRQNMRNTKTRGAGTRPVNLDFNRLYTYFNSVVDVINMRPDLMNLYKVLDRPNVKQSLEYKRPGGYNNVLIPWFKGMASQRYTDPEIRSSKIIRVASQVVRQATNASLYLAKPVTALKQFAGAASAAPFVGGTNLLLSSKDIVRTMLSDKGLYKSLELESNLIKQRRDFSPQQNIAKTFDSPTMEADWFSKGKKKVLDNLTYALIHPAQNVTDAIVYAAAKKKHLEKHPKASEKEAIRFAEETVRTTQGDTTLAGLTQSQRGNEFMKMFTMVSSFKLNMTNAVKAEVLRDSNRMAQAKAIINYGMYLVALPAFVDFMFGAATYELLTRGRDEDNKADPEQAADDFYGYQLARMGVDAFDAMLPYSGKVLSFMQGKNPTPAVRQITDLYTGVTSQVDGLPDTTAEIKSALRALSFFGIPTAPLASDLFVEDFIINTVLQEDVADREAERSELIQESKDN